MLSYKYKRLKDILLVSFVVKKLNVNILLYKNLLQELEVAAYLESRNPDTNLDKHLCIMTCCSCPMLMLIYSTPSYSSRLKQAAKAPFIKYNLIPI